MIEIHYPEKQKIFCPVCGIMTLSFGEEGQLDAELVMNDCSHLQFLGTNEGKEIDKNDLYAKHEDSVDDLSFHDYLNKTLDDDYVCFTQYVGAPSMLESYTIFKVVSDEL
tara:strand:+ start:322 stop:651 length:330 start_codon:yes stop_codon:yes gene_type:complete